MRLGYKAKETMNDIDDLQSQINDLREIVESLVMKQGLVISYYEKNQVLSPEEEKQAREKARKYLIEFSEWVDKFNKRK